MIGKDYGVTDNKQLMQQICSELAKGNSNSLIESMAEDFCWTVPGTTEWSRTYKGKREVLTKLLQPLASQFANQYTNTANRFIAEGDYVVVECRGNVMTKAGIPYNNTYCWVCRFAEGKLQELTEYCDTALIEVALRR